MHSVITVYRAACEIADTSRTGVSPLQVLSALVGFNLANLCVWERRMRMALDTQVFLTVWGAGIGLMLCWILGVEVLAGAGLL